MLDTLRSIGIGLSIIVLALKALFIFMGDREDKSIESLTGGDRRDKG